MVTTPLYRDPIKYNAWVKADKLAIHDVTINRRLTWRDVEDRVDRLARHFLDLGIAKGDRVALLARNGSEFIEVIFAANRIGAISVLLNTRLAAPELEYIVNDAGPKLLIFDHAFSNVAQEVIRSCGLQRSLSIIDGRPDSQYEQALSTSSGSAPAATVTHDDCSILMYTSGTTGRPKGAIITHGMFFWHTANAAFPIGITSEWVQLVLLPLFHIGGLNCYAMPLVFAGATLTMIKTFDAGDVLGLIGDPVRNITHVTGVPAQYLFMAQHPDFAATDLSRLKLAGMGGSSVPLSLIELWQARSVPLTEGFGMTETSALVSTLTPANIIRKRGSIGRPLFYTDVRIVDPETGTDQSANEIGELWVRGPNVTPGYWNNPQETEKAFHNGWLKTGDAARQDEEGFLYIVDRVKDMYISGGENVYPAEVESAIFQLPAVADVAIIGVPHPKWGESGTAIVVLKPGAALEIETLKAHCRSKLAAYKVPTRLEFIDALPRNASGKILKRELRQRYGGRVAPDGIVA